MMTAKRCHHSLWKGSIKEWQTNTFLKLMIYYTDIESNIYFFLLVCIDYLM